MQKGSQKMEQGSYMLIKPGMTVQGTDGTIGTVAEVVAEENIDVFRGLVVIHGLLLHKKLFVPAERVLAVTDTVVSLDLSKAEGESLPPPAVSNNS